MTSQEPPNMPDPSPEDALAELLGSLFDDLGLRRFLRHGPDGAALACELPSALAPSVELPHQAVLCLKRRGLVNQELFNRLRAERPKHGAVIEAVYQRWSGHLQPSPLVRASPPARTTMMVAVGLLLIVWWALFLLIGSWVMVQRFLGPESPPVAELPSGHTPAEDGDAPRVARCEVTDNPRPFTRPGATRIAITDFDVSGRGAKPEDGARIADLLCRALDTLVEVELKKSQIFIPPAELEIVRVPRPVRAFSDGRALGEDLGADVVLWGDGSCEIPTGELVLKASDEASRAVAGTVRARGYAKVTVEADGGATGVGGDLDVEALLLYSVCTRAALVTWDLFGASESTDFQTMNELRDLPLGSFTVGDPQAVLDLVLALHFAYRDEPLQADHFLPSVRGALADRPDLVDLALWVASIDADLSRMEDARRQLDQILQTTRAMGDKVGEGDTLFNIGRVYDALGDKKSALESFEEVLLLARAVGDRYREASALCAIGLVYNTLGDQKRALEYLEQAFVLQRAQGDRSGQATTLNNIGLVYLALGDRNRALEHFEQALPILRAVGPRNMEATTLTNIGTVYSALGDQTRALEYHEQALPILRAIGNRSVEATTLNNIGTVYHALGEQKRAIEYYEQALPIHRAIGNRLMEGTTLNNIGLAYTTLGDQNRALGYHEQALPIHRAVGNRSGEAATLHNIGLVYRSRSDTKLALEYYEQALSIHRAVGDRSGEARTVLNIGVVYSDLEDQKRALEHYEQALPILRAVGDRSGEAITLEYIGIVYKALGDRKRAREYYKQARLLQPAVGDQ
jgi:tetratricopeptide (TPR) repeat protein